MKKRLSVLLMFVMLMTLITACGKEGVSPSKNKDNETTATTLEATSATEESSKEKESDEKTTKETKSTKATEETKTQKETAKTTFSPQRGTTTDSKYTNASLGINFPLSAFSKIMTDTQIGTMMGYSQQLLDSQGLLTSEQIESLNSGVVYDFLGYFSDGKSNVIIAYEDMTKTCGKIVTESLYLDSLMAQMTQLGYKFGSTAVTTEVAGEKFYKLTGTVNGITQNYYCRAVDKYMVSLIVTTVTGNESTGENFVKSITK